MYADVDAVGVGLADVYAVDVYTMSVDMLDMDVAVVDVDVGVCDIC